MGKMGLIYRINPSNPGKESAEHILSKVSSIAVELGGSVKDYRVEPLAFGLYTLNVLIVVDEDNKDFLDRFEARVLDIDGVNSVENRGMTRL